MKYTFKLAIISVLFAVYSAPFSVAVDSQENFLPFDPDPYSTKRIKYTTLNDILSGSVLKVGASTHRRPPPLRTESASLVQLGNPRPSRLEGNRVRLHEYKSHHKQTVYDVRDALLALGDKLAIENYNKREQLAYWLNLHNSIVFAKILEIYPVTNIRRMFSAEKDNSFFHSREFSWRGTAISLSDIQNHVMDNWESPLVIYGFYLGAVGTPNIRDRAYTGASIYKTLTSNAVDFVNSVRGTFIWGQGNNKVHVSTYYRNFARMFPNFNEDLLAHIRQLAKPAHKVRLESVEVVDADISDWHIADIYNGRARTAGQIYPSNDPFGFPRHVRELFHEIILRRLRRGEVSIEELRNSTKSIDDILDDIDSK
ncbi:MAG: hypothetical protein COB37_09970 [Kordiimonadales bacterium]|nr:MAG: hypothetical protein COB37_09970 [Kordiimonadales bacterium]